MEERMKRLEETIESLEQSISDLTSKVSVIANYIESKQLKQDLTDIKSQLYKIEENTSN